MLARLIPFFLEPDRLSNYTFLRSFAMDVGVLEANKLFGYSRARVNSGGFLRGEGTDRFTYLGRDLTIQEIVYDRTTSELTMRFLGTPSTRSSATVEPYFPDVISMANWDSLTQRVIFVGTDSFRFVDFGTHTTTYRIVRDIIPDRRNGEPVDTYTADGDPNTIFREHDPAEDPVTKQDLYELAHVEFYYD